MGIRLACSAVVVLLLASVLWLPACNSCPFGDIRVMNFGGSVACCGGFDRHDVAPGPSEASEFDVSLASVPGQDALMTAWLTRGDCDLLFAVAYDAPGASPLCEVLVGPVTPGQVSSRRKLSPGPYRLFVQASATNLAKAQYIVNVGFWGKSCRIGPQGP
jgi:hypothetical protein